MSAYFNPRRALQPDEPFSTAITETLTPDDSYDSTAIVEEELQESLEAGDFYAAAMESDPTGFGLVWAALPSRTQWTSRHGRPQWEASISRLHWTVPG